MFSHARVVVIGVSSDLIAEEYSRNIFQILAPDVHFGIKLRCPYVYT